MDISKIRELCKKRSISIKDMEKAAGISNGLVGKWAAMKNTPRYDTLKAVADYLDVTVDELFATDETEGTRVGEVS